MEFNWKKALKKEKTGLLAVFSVMFLFDLLQDSIRRGMMDLKFDFWSIALIFSLCFYLLLKLFSRTPSFQKEMA